jgi:signal peptide peptidase SppA
MKMLEYVGQFIDGYPWAITAPMMHQISRIYHDHLEGKTPDIKAIEAQLGRPLTNEPQKGYETVDGIAVISVTGVIAKRMNLFMEISGGRSIELLAQDFRDALADPTVRAIMLKVDSPGGSIDGIFEFADLIYESRIVKPIVALAYGAMASAAYLIGSAAQEVYASDVATQVGSIGVVATHRDTSKIDESSGVVTTEIYRGKYKRLVTSGSLSEEARTHMEDQVDYFYSLFIDAVARYRGVSADTVLTTMSTDVNDIFIGQQAVDAGLVDGILAADRVITHAVTLARVQPPASNKQGRPLTIHKEVTMDKFATLADFVAAYPEFAAELRAQGQAQVDQEPIKAAERTRIIALIGAAASTEMAEKLTAAINSGVTAEALKALGVSFAAAPNAALEAEVADLKTKNLELIKASGAGNPGSDGGKQTTTAGKDFPTLVEEYMAAEKCSRTVALKAVDAAYPGRREKWITVVNGGKEAANV